MKRPGTRSQVEAGLAAEVALFGVKGDQSMPSSPLASGAWKQLLVQIATERIEGLLGATIAAGALPVTKEQSEEARTMLRGRARVDLRLEHELILAVKTLDEAGVAYRALKGPAWAHSIYPDPSWRGFGDVDLLIADEDWYPAVAALEATGALRCVPELRPGFELRFGKDATLQSAGGSEVDLHRTLVVGPYGLWVDRQELFERRATITVGGVNLDVLDAEAAFLHACYNAALADDPPRLIAVRDVCQMVLAADIDADDVRNMAARWRGRGVVARALSLASAAIGTVIWEYPVAERFRGVRSGVWDRALMATYRGPGRGYASQVVAVVALSGVRDRFEYLAALARPQPSYLAVRGLSPTTHLRRAVMRIWAGR
jgi:hypothetical protein